MVYKPENGAVGIEVFLRHINVHQIWKYIDEKIKETSDGKLFVTRTSNVYGKTLQKSDF